MVYFIFFALVTIGVVVLIYALASMSNHYQTENGCLLLLLAFALFVMAVLAVVDLSTREKKKESPPCSTSRNACWMR